MWSVIKKFAKGYDDEIRGSAEREACNQATMDDGRMQGSRHKWLCDVMIEIKASFVWHWNDRLECPPGMSSD